MILPRHATGPLTLRLVRAQPGQRDTHKTIAFDRKPQPAKASSLMLANRENSMTKRSISESLFFHNF
jgi:hypothetical protein